MPIASHFVLPFPQPRFGGAFLWWLLVLGHVDADRRDEFGVPVPIMRIDQDRHSGRLLSL